MKIHEHGYWMGVCKHKFDKRLLRAIIRFAKRNNVHTVADVGCGDGSYANALNKAGIDCDGYDGNISSPGIHKDFAQPVNMPFYDLVISLEVGEHIPAEYEDTFIDNILNASKRFVILSWAVEGQGGIGHVNCHNNDYIIRKITNRWFTYKRRSSMRLRRRSRLMWFKNTIMVYERR